MEFISAVDWLLENPKVEEEEKEEEKVETTSTVENLAKDIGALQIIEEQERIMKIIEEEDRIDATEPLKLNKEDVKKEEEKKEGEEPIIVMEEKENIPAPIMCKCEPAVPLIGYLCVRYHCSSRELQVMLTNVESRRNIINHLRHNVILRTRHIRPAARNFLVKCNDLTTQSAADVQALGGYLDVKVRAYYYIKHRVKLLHPYMPCVIQFGGGEHRSFYPLEVLDVIATTDQKK